MHQIELLIYSFLQEVKRGTYKVPLNLLEKFGKETQETLIKQFERRPKEFTLRMSNIGQPLCILKMEQQYGSNSSETLRFLLGDLYEASILFLLHASGIKVLAEQKQVILADTGLKGTLDVILDLGEGPEVYDIKSASEYSFKTKTNLSMEDFIAQDTFGYFNQLLAYAASENIKAGGFIFGNKSSGEIKVFAFPKEQDELKERALKDIKKKIASFKNNDPFKRDFDDIAETFRKKPTGNRILGITCGFCDHKFRCWPNLQVLKQAKSEAKNPKMVFYTEHNEIM